MENKIGPSGDSSESPSRNSKRKSHPLWRWFWLAFLVLSLGYAWYSFYVPSNDVIWTDDTESARQLASKSNKPVMMFFTATWCVPSRIMKREVFGKATFMEMLGNLKQ
jgi:protein disulfide-isomerase